MKANIKKYEDLSEPVRWMLFIPINLITTFIIGILIFFWIGLIQINAIKQVIEIFHPALSGSIGMAIAYYTAPRFKKAIISLEIILFSVLFLIMLIGFIFALINLIPKAEIFIYENIKESSKYIIGLIVSITTYKFLIKEKIEKFFELYFNIVAGLIFLSFIANTSGKFIAWIINLFN